MSKKSGDRWRSRQGAMHLPCESNALGWHSVIYMARGWLNMAMILHCGNHNWMNRLSGPVKRKLQVGIDITAYKDSSAYTVNDILLTRIEY